MAHRLNTNKQFMIGNGILAFAVIFVVVIFVYMSMRLQQRKEGERNFIETYTITLTKGFAGDSTSIFINDSLLVNRTIAEEPFTIEVKRFAEQSALMIVNNATEKLLSGCDKLDIQILREVISKESYSKIAAKLFIAENTISYRIKKILAGAPGKSKEEIFDLLSEFLF